MAEFSMVTPSLECPDCGHFPQVPVSGFCGHTRCRACVDVNVECPCGIRFASDHAMNIVVNNLVNQILLTQNASKQDVKADNIPMEPQEINKGYNGGPIKTKRYRHVHEPIYARPKDARVKTRVGSARVSDDFVKKMSGELECAICMDRLTQPVTTPCGHTFCRECIMRALIDTEQCPLCCGHIERITMCLMKDNAFIVSLMDTVCPRTFIPVSRWILTFKCTMAFPNVPSPIWVRIPYVAEIVNYILNCGTRHFGVISEDKHESIPAVGTIVEVKDCVLYPNGDILLTTIGVKRFKIIDDHDIEASLTQPMAVARVVDVIDTALSQEQFEKLDLQRLARNIRIKMLSWYSRLPQDFRKFIEDSYGPMPSPTLPDMWWLNPHCDSWFWWITAVVPFGADLQVLMLATTCLHKRMRAIERILDLIIYN